MENETQYIGSELITTLCERGTRQQWKNYLLTMTQWFAEDETDETIEEWAERICDTELTEWDGDESFIPM